MELKDQQKLMQLMRQLYWEQQQKNETMNPYTLVFLEDFSTGELFAYTPFAVTAVRIKAVANPPIKPKLKVLKPEFEN